MIDADDLSFAYRKTKLYDRFELHLERPGVYGLFGRNGSGKSTLLKLLSGLLFPQVGRLRVLGHEPRRRHPDFLASVYLIPEEFHLPDLTAAGLARAQAGFYPRFSPAAYGDYLAELEVPSDQRFEEMSLGQKKKAALAFALATMTPLLLLDEPTNGLDIVSRDQFRKVVARPEQRDRMIVISTHQAHDLERIMDHILFIDGARVALSATMSRLQRSLRMGAVADEGALAELGDVIYRESFGEQWAYVSRRTDDQAGTVQLEMVYKAICRNRDGVLSALGGSEPEASDA